MPRVNAWRSISGSRIASRPGRAPQVAPPGRRGPSGQPGLLLQHEIALDCERAAAGPEIEQLDEVGIDVELVARVAEATGDPEAQPLAAVGQSERRVESASDQGPATGGAALAP